MDILYDIASSVKLAFIYSMNFIITNTNPLIMSTLCQICSFCTFWSGIYITTHNTIGGSFREHPYISSASVKAVMKHWNRLYACLSFGLLLLILGLLGVEESTARVVYFSSKMVEEYDILLVVLSGGSVSLYFGFHHLTAPLFAAFRVMSPDGFRDGGYWRVFAVLNAYHHILMYAFFGGIVPRILRPRAMLAWTGTFQLVVGIAVDLWVGYHKFQEGSTIRPYIASVVLLSCYLVLNTRDLMQRESKHNEDEEANEELKKA